MRRFLVPVFAFFVLAAGTGCSAATDEDTEASLDELRSLSIKESDNGKTFTVEKGRSFKVSLGANPSTGYSWKVVSTTRSLGYPSPAEGVYQGGGASGPVGSGGKQVFTWKTDGPVPRASATAHAVTLEYRRPWEGDDVPAAKTFKFKIKIKEGAAPPAPEPPAPPAPIALFEENDGDEIRATDGQALKILLSENPTTGYRWRVVDDGALPEPQSEYQSDDSGRIGGGGVRVLTWDTAGKVGTHTIELKYSRASGAALKTFQVTLVVADD